MESMSKLTKMRKEVQRLANGSNRETFAEAIRSMNSVLLSMQEENAKLLERIEGMAAQPAPQVDVASIGTVVADAVSKSIKELKLPDVKVAATKPTTKKPVAYKLSVERDSRGDMTGATFEPVKG